MSDDLTATDRPLLKRPIALVGMMGAGKTAIGTALAKALHVPFRDSDAEIEAAANMTIAEIFEKYGEPFFREREAQIIARLLADGPMVLSTGGGAYLRQETRERIAEMGGALWLKVDLELLWSRVKHKDTRPLLRTDDPKRTLADLLAERTPYYSQAELAVEAREEESIEAMTERVIAALDAAEMVAS